MIIPFPQAIDYQNLPEIGKYAIREHGPQMYGALPYAFHLQHVSNAAEYFDLDPDLKKASWTHDLCEDKGKTKQEIAEQSNQRVARLTWAVSGFGDNRAERMECVMIKIPEEPGSEDLKMIDRGCNLIKCLMDLNLSMLKLYAVKEHPIISQVFPDGGPVREWLEGIVEEARIVLTSKPGKIIRPR